MFLKLSSIVGLLIAFNGLAFGAVLAVQALRGRSVNPAIPAMVGCLSALMTLNILYDFRGNVRLTELRFALQLIIGPIFLAFVLRDCGRPFPSPFQMLLHASPAAALAITVLIRQAPAALLAIIIPTHITAYLTVSVVVATRYGAGPWTYVLSLLGGSAIALNIGLLAAGIGSEGPGEVMEASLFAILLIMVCALIIAGLSGPLRLIGPSLRRPGDSEAKRLDGEAVSRIVDRIETLLAAESPHLDPGFRLGDLARLLREPERRVSQAINEAFAMTVPDFLNQQRIMAVQSRLSDPAEDASLLEIAFDCGFSSKATFNRAFARHTGSTPSRVRASTFR